jgi:branched-chain amino acid transport system ATP-binding protein
LPLAETKGITKHFGGLVAVDGVDLQIGQGEILGLIGPNGAGKTTLFNLITGFLKPSGGKVFFDGEDITAHRPPELAAKGIVRTFQATVLFRETTVFENVVLGHHLSSRLGIVPDMLGLSTARQARKESHERVVELLSFLGIAHLKDELAKNLPHGHQRVLGMAIALAANPKLLLLDEPATGMNPEEARQLMALIGRVRERGITIMLVEHDMKVVMGVCDRVAVLHFGRKIAEGPPEQIKLNREVIEAYLGTQNVV